ncbi:microtubule-actin cross-linking factor 1 [Platysternon megacephalum]|uniref:Microtubule-actin cross-linking factor 1 n=1 Tax=Platysternon megacephalum TaxID=55544 RepID=A0A4D9F3E0_9SAUR|nr:microtubule-actin cross-linking factor 1 [Platysternon megacephalum]
MGTCRLPLVVGPCLQEESSCECCGLAACPAGWWGDGQANAGVMVFAGKTNPSLRDSHFPGGKLGPPSLTLNTSNRGSHWCWRLPSSRSTWAPLQVSRQLALLVAGHRCRAAACPGALLAAAWHSSYMLLPWQESPHGVSLLHMLGLPRAARRAAGHSPSRTRCVAEF